MFTGLIEELGRVAVVDRGDASRRFWIEASRVLEDARVGDSIALSGCCLTAVAIEPARFAVEAVPETLRRTTLGEWNVGETVNLERALRLDQRLGGHFVQGHVDGVGVVREFAPEGDGRRLTLDVPPSLERYVAEQGSIAVDGVSLTVAALVPGGCEIAYIPHTLAVTTAASYSAGRRVHLEVDLLARYLGRLLEGAGLPRRTS